MIDLEDIEAARQRIVPHVRRTPVMEAALARAALPVSGKVTFKLSSLRKGKHTYKVSYAGSSTVSKLTVTKKHTAR